MLKRKIKKIIAIALTATMMISASSMPAMVNAATIESSSAVSEETGTISLTKNGAITRGYNSQSLQQELYGLFVEREEKKISVFKNILSKKSKGDDKNE